MPREYPAGFEPSLQNINIVKVDREFMNLDPRFVPVETDLKEIPKIPRGARNVEHEIKKAYSDFEFKKEQEYLKP